MINMLYTHTYIIYNTYMYVYYICVDTCIYIYIYIYVYTYMYLYIHIYIRENLLHIQEKADEIRRQRQEEITKEREKARVIKKN
jgi:hypothetical protein